MKHIVKFIISFIISFGITFVIGRIIGTKIQERRAQELIWDLEMREVTYR